MPREAKPFSMGLASRLLGAGELMRILLTGGRGMVGRNILESAQTNEHEIVAPTRDELDLRDAEAVRSFFANVRPDAVVHAAGVVGGIAANIADPTRFLRDNLQIGVNVIESARSAGVPDLLNLGSSCMYPRFASNPLVEDSILTGELEPTNEGYAIAKIATERLCRYISSQYPEHRYRTLIPCNLYGRHDSFAEGRAHMVPAAIVKVHRAKEEGADEVEIWGTGTARREFMYAGDLADFVFFALDRMEALPQVINVGVGTDRSINEYYQAVADVVGYRGGYRHDLSKPVGMGQKLVDISLATALGWRARTSLQEGLSKTYEFYLETDA